MEPNNNQPKKQAGDKRPAKPGPVTRQSSSSLGAQGSSARRGQTGATQRNSGDAASPRRTNPQRSTYNGREDQVSGAKRGAGNPGQQRGTNRTPKGTRPGRKPQTQRPIIPASDAVPVNKSVYNGAGGEQMTQKTKLANRPNREPVLKVIPLGGLGEVGKNMTAFEFGDDIIVVDMGFAFPEDREPGVDYIIPDVTYLEKNKHKIRGHILTHGHEDHMGGIPYILPKLPAPFYGARFSLGMVEKKLVEHKLTTQPQFRVMDPDKHEKVQMGAFTVELVRVTHAIPDACAVLIKTPVGNVFHTGDFRFDTNPADGKPVDFDRIKQIGQEGVMLLMSDSTSCEFLGHSPTESDIEPSFEDLFRRAKGRVIVSSFSSQLNRVQLLINATQKTGRKLAVTGRSMLANIELAVKLGYLKFPPGLLVRMQDLNSMKDDQIVVLSTGSQGEINSALVRMSTGDHQHIKIKPSDTIIMSSSIIPGNEIGIIRSIDNLMREGGYVYHNMWRNLDECGILHVGGHAWQDELAEMIQLTKPKYFMPIHGEFHMQVHHSQLAEKQGIPRGNIFIFDNGDVLEITPSTARRGERVPAGGVMVDGSGVGDVNEIVLRDRLAMAEEGVFMIVATVDRRTGKLVTSPDIISRGFIYMKDSEELVQKARALVRTAFEKRSSREPADWSKFKLKLRDDMSDFLYKRTRRNPMIVPVINEV